MLLVRAHVVELLLLHHLHHRLLQGLADQDLEDRLDLRVEVEEVALINLRLHVHARLHRYEDGGGELVHEGVRLRVDVDLDRPVRQLLQVLLRLHVDVLPPLSRLRRVRLWRQLRPLEAALLLGLRGGREDLRGVCVPPHDALVVHDVVWLRDRSAGRIKQTAKKRRSE